MLRRDGLRKSRFRMLMLGKRMEIGRPGDLWGESGFWTAAELKQGFPVTITASDDRNLPLPETFDLSDFQGERERSSADYLQNITRDGWDNETRGQRRRTYAYEIVVLAPGDEPVMPKDGCPRGAKRSSDNEIVRSVPSCLPRWRRETPGLRRACVFFLSCRGRFALSRNTISRFSRPTFVSPEMNNSRRRHEHLASLPFVKYLNDKIAFAKSIAQRRSLPAEIVYAKTSRRSQP